MSGLGEGCGICGFPKKTGAIHVTLLLGLLLRPPRLAPRRFPPVIPLSWSSERWKGIWMDGVFSSLVLIVMLLALWGGGCEIGGVFLSMASPSQG